MINLWAKIRENKVLIIFLVLISIPLYQMVKKNSVLIGGSGIVIGLERWTWIHLRKKFLNLRDWLW